MIDRQSARHHADVSTPFKEGEREGRERERGRGREKEREKEREREHLHWGVQNEIVIF